MRDHVIDVVHRDADGVEHLVQQQRGVRHRRSMNSPPGIGEHSGAWLVALGIAEAEAAVVRHCREAGELDAPPDPALARSRRSAAPRVAEGQRGQFLADDVADVPGRVLAELRDVLAADHKHAFGQSLPDPVVGHRDTGEHSGTRVRQVERLRVRRPPDRGRDGAAHRRLQPLRQAAVKLRDAAADDDIHR